MPANLTPDFQAAEKRYKAAATPQEKIAALEEMLSTIPKHKGTEKMQADIKRRLSQQRKESQKKGGPSKSTGIHIKKSGEGQIVLIGPPNSGKSQILDMLTAAEPEVADYPYTTRMPTPGMMFFEDVQLQLIDLPPIADGYIESWLPQIIRVADAALLVLSCHNDDILSHYDDTLRILREYKIELCKEEPPEEEQERGIAYVPTVLVANKMDTPGAKDILSIFLELNNPPFDMLELNATDEESLKQIPTKMYEFLDLVRVYAKEPGKPASMERPFVFRRGGTLFDLAYEIHSDFAENLKTAKVWGAGKFDGQLVNRDYELEDKDVIELHI
jgi:ribosome-interacting GTPase 1